MRVNKIEFFDILCHSCGSKITLRADEYKKYLEETSDFGNEIICTEQLPGEDHEVECARYYISCPVCGESISLNLSPLDAEKYGFNLPAGVEPFYGSSYEVHMEDFLKKHFGELDVEEEKEEE